jgi:DNA-directed RNA polymerase specialized sigma subunit
MSFYVREYLDLKARIMKLNKVKIEKGMSKDELLKLTTEVGLNDLEVNILVSFYCERKSIQSIAYHTNYSYDRIWQLKNEALKKIRLTNS